jgi:hypothetical protein
MSSRLTARNSDQQLGFPPIIARTQTPAVFFSKIVWIARDGRVSHMTVPRVVRITLMEAITRKATEKAYVNSLVLPVSGRDMDPTTFITDHTNCSEIKHHSLFSFHLASTALLTGLGTG